MLLQFTINNINAAVKATPISDINNPIYMISYIDKHENQKIDANKKNYITLNFETPE